MGATFTKATNKTAKPHDLEKRAPFVLSNILDFADGTQFPTKPVNTDVVEAVAIPAKTMIQRAWVDVEVGETGGTDVDVGIGGAADHLLDGINISATGRKSAAGTNGGKTLILDAADTVDVLLNAAVTYDEGKIKVSVLCIDME